LKKKAVCPEWKIVIINGWVRDSYTFFQIELNLELHGTYGIILTYKLGLWQYYIFVFNVYLLLLLRGETPLWEWRVCLSVGAITFDRLEIFNWDFGYAYQMIHLRSSSKMDQIGRPFKVKGQKVLYIRFKYITPHVTYRWKGLVKSFLTICNLWTVWPLYDLQGRFWGQSSTPSC
jgi:hypothetical protein